MSRNKLTFHGAAQRTTGSFHLLRIGRHNVALDAGLFQGRRQEARELNRHFPLRPQKLDAVLLSHAHIDHSGNIPQLVGRGFSGTIHATGATCDLCRIMLADSAHIQAEDARFWNEKRARTDEEKIEPLYTIEDARASESHFSPVGYNEPLRFADGAQATFIEAGHILGSACILVELDEGRGPRLLYTGDLGRANMPILRDPAEPLPEVDYLITECTYADRRHENPTDMKQRLATIINQTRDAGGKVIIPAFSVGRTQNIVYYLSQAMSEGLMEPLPIYVDSPLSVNATEVFKKHPECYDRQARRMYRENGDIFGEGRVNFITRVEESKRLNEMDEPMVIIASSGMCEAGRILHHLKNNIADESNTVIIVGFQAQHTLGRRIVERREEVKIFGRMYPLLCRIEVLNGFSAHADRRDFVRMFKPIAGKLKAAFVVHGEGSQPTAMREILKSAGCEEVHIPSPGDTFDL
ncbi:MAG: MBL fold metallo-hydrolase [Phycisphaerae bacterium]